MQHVREEAASMLRRPSSLSALGDGSNSNVNSSGPSDRLGKPQSKVSWYRYVCLDSGYLGSA
jgi:hypothetical protein